MAQPEICPEVLNDWYPVARVDAVGEGKLYSARLMGHDLVLWRGSGQVNAWQDLCLHRGMKLSLGKVEDGLLVCPYHGWGYEASGHCTNIPAHPGQRPPDKARPRAFPVRERYGIIWTSLGHPERDVPSFPEEADPAYRKVLCGPSAMVNASAARIIENFLDVAHFPFVHGGILGDRSRPEVPDYRVESAPEGIVAHDIRVYQPDPYGDGVPHEISYVYRTLRPFMAYLAKNADDGERFALAAFLTPHDELHTTAWFYMAVNERDTRPADQMIAHQIEIFSQDQPIVESQRPEFLPLDPQAELHLRSDRLAIAYRRWLRELGITYGTIYAHAHMEVN